MKNSIPVVSFLKFSLFLLLTVSLTITQAQVFKLDGKRKKYSMDFRTAQNLIIIPIYINGKGPFNFLLDTGASQMIITDTTFLKGYEIKNYQKVKVRGYGLGENIDAILTNDMAVRVGKSQMRNVPTAIFTEDIFNLSSYLGVRIYGILGYYFFNSFKVRINYARNRLTLYAPEYPVKIKGDTIPILLRNSKPYMTSEIQLPDSTTIKLDLLIDNGSSNPLSLESIDQKPFPLPATTIPANLGVGINGIISGHIGRVPVFKIGNYTFHNVLSGFPEFNREVLRIEGSERNGSIGADILRHFTVTFDYQNNSMYLDKQTKGEPQFDHDMSGMEIYVNGADKRNRFYIGRIETGSPAEAAGLLPEDEIVSVDFRSMAFFELSDLTEMLKNRNGRQILIEVVRDKKNHIVILELKRRI